MDRTAFFLFSLLFALFGCALPQPTQIERQDFVSKREVLLADIVRSAQDDYSRGRLFDAELGLRKALVLAPDVTQIVLNLGRTLAKNGQPAEAHRVFNRLLLRKPKDLEILNFIGESFFEGAEFATAAEYFNRAMRIIDESEMAGIAVDPVVSDRTLRNIGTTAFRSGDLMLALCSVHAAYEIAQSPENLIRLVRLELALGASQNAEDLVTSFFTFTPGNTDPRLFLLRAIARADQKKNSQTIEDLNAALKREQLILEFALELRLMAGAYIPPVVDAEGEEHQVDEIAEEDVVPEALSDIQRLYLPESVLRTLDAYREEKEKQLAER